MITADDTREIAAALEVLDEVLAVRLAAKHTDGAVEQPPGLPALEHYGGAGPLAQVVAIGNLTQAEALVLVAAIAPEIDPRYDAMYGMLADRPDRAYLTGEVARTLCTVDLEAQLRFANVLSPSATLRSAGMLELEAGGETQLSGRLRADPELVSWLLGRSAEFTPAVSDLPAQRVTTVHTMDDIVSSTDRRQRVGDLVLRIRNRSRVVDEWGFGAAHDGSRGLLALFHGPPGTGKTMTAAVIGQVVGLPVWRVDLSTLVSKFIGETAKQCARIFDRAAREGWLLVFDEADAVFGKRTEVSDAHDRYANQEISYLLNRVEDHPGVVILTTNLLANIDEAFLRRVQVVIDFAPPGVSERTELWQRVVPRDLPIDPFIDRAALAQRYDLTGAQIRDATLEAAYLAAASDGPVSEQHLITAIRRQYEKAGRSVPGL